MLSNLMWYASCYFHFCSLSLEVKDFCDWTCLHFSVHLDEWEVYWFYLFLWHSLFLLVCVDLDLIWNSFYISWLLIGVIIILNEFAYVEELHFWCWEKLFFPFFFFFGFYHLFDIISIDFVDALFLLSNSMGYSYTFLV